jgi:hypothetical protein
MYRKKAAAVAISAAHCCWRRNAQSSVFGGNGSGWLALASPGSVDSIFLSPEMVARMVIAIACV